jgi:hypothetical protein
MPPDTKKCGCAKKAANIPKVFGKTAYWWREDKTNTHAIV